MNVHAFATTFCPPFMRPIFDRIQNSPIGTRLARGMFWSFTGGAISRGLTLIATISVARILGKISYGELGIIQSTVGMFGVFAGFGLGVTATKHVGEFRQKDPERVGRILGLSSLVAMGTGGLMTIGLFFLAPWVAEYTINAPQLGSVLKIGSLILLFDALNSAQTGALAGYEAFKSIARINVMVGISAVPILVLGAWFGGLKGAVWALAINLAFNWLLNHLALRKESHKHNVPSTYRHCYQECSILWKFSLPAFLAGSVGGPATWVCNALLVNQPDGYSKMGIFSAASQWFTFLLFIPGILSQVILPIFSDQLGQRNISQTVKTLILAVKVNTAIVIPLVLVGSIASPYIMGLYGAEFRSGWPVLIAVLINAGVLCMQMPVAGSITAFGKMWFWFAVCLGWAATYIAITASLLKFGAFGLAVSRALAYGLQGIILFYYFVILVKKGSEKAVRAD